MSRRNLIDGLVTSLRSASGFSNAEGGTVVAYDHRVLSTGVARAAIVLASRADLSDMAIKIQRRDHYLTVQVLVRHANDVVAARQAADTAVDAVLARIQDDWTLGGSAHLAVVTETSVQDEHLEIGRVAFLLEEITVRATGLRTGA